MTPTANRPHERLARTSFTHAMKTDWNPILAAEFSKPYWTELQQYVFDERTRHEVYPAT